MDGIQMTEKAEAQEKRREGMWVEGMWDAEQLLAHEQAWATLATEAVEPNVFYEPWMLLPALRLWGEDHVGAALVFEAGAKGKQLCGVFPVQRRRTYNGLPVTALRLWKYRHCYLCTPLIRSNGARECLAAFCRWAGGGEGAASLMEFSTVAGDGPFHHLLLEHLTETRSLAFWSECHTRAMLRVRDGDGEAYMRTAMSGESRRILGRKKRRLAEMGRLECVTPVGEEDVREAIDDFLVLEAGGWKGRRGSAMAADEMDRLFFEKTVLEAHRRGRLMLLTLHLDGRPVAQRYSFRAGDGAYAFKIAYDERYGHYSPGVLLEVENIHRLHAQPCVRWMDSCSALDSATLNRVWKDRQTIQSVAVPTGRRMGEWWVSVLPMLRWLNRKRLRWLRQ